MNINNENIDDIFSDIESSAPPASVPTDAMKPKKPVTFSQLLRAVIFRRWQNEAQAKFDSEFFYEQEMKEVIAHQQSLLNEPPQKFLGLFYGKKINELPRNKLFEVIDFLVKENSQLKKKAKK